MNSQPTASAAAQETPLSLAKLAANRANAQLSTGPTSGEGKSKSSLNAVKTALTGRTVLLPTDDAAAYEHHVREFEKEYQPIGVRECALVQSIADTFWRMNRVSGLEMAIFARGRSEFAAAFEHEDASTRPALIDLHTFLTYEKQIRNLQLQEARLHRRYQKDSAELRQLQQERKSREEEKLRPASPKLQAGGFVFSNQPKAAADLLTTPAETDSAASPARSSSSPHGPESQPSVPAARAA